MAHSLRIDTAVTAMLTHNCTPVAAVPGPGSSALTAGGAALPAFSPRVPWPVAGRQREKRRG
jgi:hypothetical protein